MMCLCLPTDSLSQAAPMDSVEVPMAMPSSSPAVLTQAAPVVVPLSEPKAAPALSPATGPIMSSMGTPRSTTRRMTNVVSAWVLPVPALASIRCRPDPGSNSGLKRSTGPPQVSKKWFDQAI